jgi:hypothetical protein
VTSPSPSRFDRYPSPTLSVVFVVFVSVLPTLGGCKVDATAFQSRVFECDPSSAHPLCGTDQDGKAMTCFPGQRLGATNFCTQSCDGGPMSLPEEEAMCVQGGAKLKACKPSEGDDACGRPEFGCLRTDVTSDEGVCVTMKPCTADSDCHDPVRSTCATTFFNALYSKNPTLKDNKLTTQLYCLQEGCVRDGTACSPGEVCLKQVIPAAGHPPDICVPKCGSNFDCPPNFLCLSDPSISGPGNPSVCVPGLLGFKCGSDVDCLVGHCRSDDGAQAILNSTSLNLCTVDCTSDADCGLFDSDQGLFFCNPAHHCVTPQAYLGASCNSQADCVRDPQTTTCAFLSGPGEQGTCIHPCTDGVCPTLGGVPHDCVGKSATSPGVCLPGLFGIPCATNDGCVPGLTCRDVAPGAKLCTALCQNDADCDGNRWVAGQAFCGGQVCLPLGSLPEGSPCARDDQCGSGSCVAPTGDSGATPTCGAK